MSEEPEDIDQFLYGDEANFVQQAKEKQTEPDYVEYPQEIPDPDAVADEEDKVAEADKEAGEAEQEEDEEEEFEIVLGGASEPAKRGLTQVSLSAEATKTAESSLSKPSIDINAVGQLNGQSIFDVEMDSFEEKPWNQPGADITDYFNYGFTEHTWRQYCLKQKQLREEYGGQKRIAVFDGSSMPMPPFVPPAPGKPPVMPPGMPPFPFPPGANPPAGFPFPPFMFPGMPPFPKPGESDAPSGKGDSEPSRRDDYRSSRTRDSRDPRDARDGRDRDSGHRSSRRERTPSRSRSRSPKRRRP